MNDIYTGTITKFSCGPAAEFAYDHPVYYFHDDQHPTLETHFRLNLESLLIRIKNLMKRKNGAPHNLTEEFAALKMLVPVYCAYIFYGKAYNMS